MDVCIWAGMSSLDKIELMYAVPFAMGALLWLIPLACRVCLWFRAGAGASATCAKVTYSA